MAVMCLPAGKSSSPRRIAVHSTKVTVPFRRGTSSSEPAAHSVGSNGRIWPTGRPRSTSVSTWLRRRIRTDGRTLRGLGHADLPSRAPSPDHDRGTVRSTSPAVLRELRAAWLGCVGWPTPPSNPPAPLHVDHRAPTILLTNSRHDTVTRYQWALSVHRQTPDKTVLLTYAGSGHGSYLRGACMRATVDAYLLEQDLPEPGTVCLEGKPGS
ncbi:alpha/beta hydrolase [Amycolatopsis sp. H20-H5]|uniref:alpha/beta hydrolase n=1 Tax=Amycolatopsis sp. H20-H5 TaxID=3046309 RepID=UPI002DBC3080|nr:alpha/beta hydrolase [Amycolatopsis sp. H20-H5]MEC3982845.1 alpha/beta hydrolase [Amycolatopsis sp. H20-H5]